MKVIVYLLTLLEKAGLLIMIVTFHHHMIHNSQTHPLKVMPSMRVMMMSFVYTTLPPLVELRSGCPH